MAFVDDLFLPLKAGLSFLLLFRRTLPTSLLRRSGVWEWVLRGRILDSCSSSWNRDFHEFPPFLHVQLIMLGSCYGTALKETKTPVITLVQVLGSYY